MRAAIYARYSSDLQSAASITDQVRLCRRLAEERGWTVVEVFADEAVSGATHLRAGFQSMQQAAMAGAFDVLVSEVSVVRDFGTDGCLIQEKVWLIWLV